ncbi:hypothetical protein CYMTET_34182 [Cymbomonas tetramitiformis]|uniref:Uncharacterized protein n=1 Tax=Cymbomonas tetramitiformis TaxID=36881 RepID=A0AAE0FBS1_9CHLO|nr:hypothetical protein CYMTET_34182 [Cymbomonas tetramitiformis]
MRQSFLRKEALVIYRRSPRAKRAVLAVLSLLLIVNSINIFRESDLITRAALSQKDSATLAGYPAGSPQPDGAVCEKIKEDIAQRTDRSLIRNGALYSCAECEGMLGSKLEEHGIHSCSKCGLIKPRRNSGSSAILKDDRIPRADDLGWRPHEGELSDWFVHGRNARRLGRANLTRSALPLDGNAALAPFGGTVGIAGWLAMQL